MGGCGHPQTPPSGAPPPSPCAWTAGPSAAAGWPDSWSQNLQTPAAQGTPFICATLATLQASSTYSGHALHGQGALCASWRGRHDISGGVRAYLICIARAEGGRLICQDQDGGETAQAPGPPAAFCSPAPPQPAQHSSFEQKLNKSLSTRTPFHTCQQIPFKRCKLHAVLAVRRQAHASQAFSMRVAHSHEADSQCSSVSVCRAEVAPQGFTSRETRLAKPAELTSCTL